jgi:hypothetical protein
MDCDDDFLVTMSINSPRSSVAVGTPKVSTIFVRELQSGKVVNFKVVLRFALERAFNFFLLCNLNVFTAP